MNPSVVIKTNFGDIGVELFPEAAPKSVSNFLQYAFDDYYDNLVFHRIDNFESFVIQVGRYSLGVQDGTYLIQDRSSLQRAPVQLESDNGLSNLRGTIGLARSSTPDSATSEFYFNLRDNVGFDYVDSSNPGYTVFGRITSGIEVMDTIGNLELGIWNGIEGLPVSGPAGISKIELLGSSDQFIELEEYVAQSGNIFRINGSVSQVTLVEMSDGAWAVRETGGWSIAKLVGYERVLLNDKAIGLDLDGSAGQAYRVYKAAFDRDPMQGDTEGLGFWIAQIDNGMDMVEVAARFIDSNEFRTLYGENASDGDFLIGLYRNVLDRAPDAGGYAWWMDQLENNPEKTWEKVLADFSESPENQANVAELIGNGIYFDQWVG
jgi:cyclophilin family peptidyl-prolyl cis-trans isomerase